MNRIRRWFLGIFLIGMFLIPGAAFAEATGEVAVPKVSGAEIVPPPAAPNEGLLMTGLGSIGVGDLLKKAG
ncbi:MAG: hypothetical protein WCJ71_03655, partial [Candidatus Omnitrophota bacterium]